MRFFLLLGLVIFVACEAPSSDKYFWTKSYTMPLLENEEGKVIAIESRLLVGQYSSHGDVGQRYNGAIKGSIVAVWKVTRLKGGKPDFDKLCGEEPKYPDFTRDELINEEDRVKREEKGYYKKRRSYWTCVHKVQAKAKENTIAHYYYARSKASYRVVFPKKGERHSHWEMNVYKGRVGDLDIDSLTKEQRENIKELRSHPCYKFTKLHGVPREACYDLKGSDANLYYSIREIEYAKNTTKKKSYASPWEYVSDVYISAPQKWHEIEGIEIDEKMYKHLKYWCDIEKYCNLEKYDLNLMTKEQRDYIKRVKR